MQLGIRDMGQGPAAPATGHDWRDRWGLSALVVAQVVSETGNRLTGLAIPWFVYVTTGSATRAGLVAFAGYLPVLLAGIVGGAVVDRLGYRRSSIIADLASAATVLTIPLLWHLDLLAFWHLLVMAFLGSLLDVPGGAARQALVPQLTVRAGTSLERANTAMQTGFYVASLAGPLTAGVLIGWLGAANVLLVDAVSFVLAAAVVSVAIPSGAGRQRGAVVAQPRLREGLLDGVRLLARDRVLATIVAASVLANFVFAPLGSVVFPVYVRQLFGNPSALGLLMASFGAGSLAGTLLFGAFAARLPRGPIFGAGVLVMAGGLWLMPFSSWLLLSVLGGLVMGLGIGPLNVLAMTLLHERVPDGLLGRVYGTLAALSQLSVPAGMLIAGVLVDRIGFRWVLTLDALAFSLIALWVFANPDLRRVGRPAPQQEVQ